MMKILNDFASALAWACFGNHSPPIRTRISRKDLSHATLAQRVLNALERDKARTSHIKRSIPPLLKSVRKPGAAKAKNLVPVTRLKFLCFSDIPTWLPGPEAILGEDEPRIVVEQAAAAVDVGCSGRGVI